MNAKELRKLGDPFVKTQARIDRLGPEYAPVYERLMVERLEQFLDAVYLEALNEIQRYQNKV
jgi:hypothetical protein